MAAWLFTVKPFVYVSVFAPHADVPSTMTGQTKDFSGEWWRPVEVPE